MKRRLVSMGLIIIIICSVILAAGCERENEALVDMDKAWYAVGLNFHARIVIDDEILFLSTLALDVMDRIHPNSSHFDTSYTELVFVHTADEAEEFPDNVIVAWPGPRTPHFIPGIYLFVGLSEEDMAELPWTREIITFEEFGLSYPLTIEDFVDNWESVHALWQSLTQAEQGAIRSGARRDRDAERENEESES